MRQGGYVAAESAKDRGLFLHEVVDIVGQGQYAYMEHVNREPVQQMDGMMRLQGTFFVCAAGGGGRWPQVVNVWDLGPDGWDAWARNVDRLNLKRRRAFYGDWWDTAAQWRSGGTDRLLGAMPGSPTTAEIAERGITGTLFLHELQTIAPERRDAYLDDVARTRVPLMHEYGHEMVGLYEVLGDAREVVLLWATSIPAQAALRRAEDRARGHGARGTGGTVDDRLTSWRATTLAYGVHGSAEVMTPLPGTVYGPADWEDADLSDWLGDSSSREPQNGDGA
ncbi:MAG TPA: hypothetical protein VHE83_14635 [Mycobacteriales bacterium]|nr:hypothetical protein [Mycobacteriales bacterium]